MGWRRKALAVLLVIAVVVGVAAVYVYSQYKQLKVSVDRGQSGVAYAGAGKFQLRVVLRLTNDGIMRLAVPPTDFETWVDGIYAGPGDTPKSVVPARGSTTTTAIVTIDQANAAQAYYALVDPGSDKINVEGKAHLRVLGLTFDFPFDGTFTVNG